MNIYSGFTLQHSLPFPFSYEMLQRIFNYLQNWGSYNANNVKEVKSGKNHLQTEDTLCSGQNHEKWKTGDKQDYYKLYLTCMLKMAYMFFILSILVVCDIQK